jgi:small subunit ribosomal protein S14
MGGKAQLLRDIRKRISADQFEVQRRAFLYVARNTALSNTVRHKAQLGLNALNGGEGRMHAVKNRCVETGRGRGELLMPSVEATLMTGIMSKFGLWRVCLDRWTQLIVVPIPSQGA